MVWLLRLLKLSHRPKAANRSRWIKERIPQRIRIYMFRYRNTWISSVLIVWKIGRNDNLNQNQQQISWLWYISGFHLTDSNYEHENQMSQRPEVESWQVGFNLIMQMIVSKHLFATKKMMMRSDLSSLAIWRLPETPLVTVTTVIT